MSTQHYGQQFFYFINPTDDENSRGYGNNLTDHLRTKGKNIRDKFIIAMGYLKQGDPTEKKKFTYFDSARKCYEWIERVPYHERTFYEYVLGCRPQKPHFDVDCEINKNNLEESSLEFENYTTQLLYSIHKVLGDCKVIVPNPAEQYRIYDASGPKGDMYKLSRHIVVTGIQHRNNEEAKGFYNLVKAELTERVGVVLMDKFTLDDAVYGITQQFRMIGCQKPESNRPLRPLSTVAGVPIARSTDILICSEGFSSDYADFLDSILEPTGNLAYDTFSHESLLKPTKKTINNTVYGFDEDPIELAHRLLAENPEVGKIYAVERFDKDKTRLNLRYPGRFECPCHGRTHDSNGAFITVDKAGRCLLRCWAGGPQRLVVLGRVKVTSGDGVPLVVSEEYEDEVAQSVLSDPSSDNYMAFCRSIEEVIRREQLLIGCAEKLDSFVARYLPNTTEMRYVELCEPATDSIAMGYQDMRGWTRHPSVGSVVGKFMRNEGWNVPAHNSTPQDEYLPPGEVSPQDVATPGNRDFLSRYYYARSVKFYEITEEICRYLTVNHKIRAGKLHCQEGDKHIILKCDEIPKLIFKFNYPEPLTPKDDPSQYPLGYKFSKKYASVEYTVKALMNGNHFDNVKFHPLIRKQMEVRWLELRTKLSLHPNTMPYLPGDPVPLRGYKDVNEFSGFNIRNLRKICKEHNNDYKKLQNHPLVQPYISHVWLTFANRDMRKLNELLSFLIYPLVKNGMRTGKILSIFGPKSAGKSLFWCSVMRAIYGAAASLGEKLSAVLEEFNAAFAGKMMIVFDEASFAETREKTNGKLINGLKNMATDEIRKIRGLYKEKQDTINYANTICLSNNPSSCNWIENDPRNKRNLNYLTAVVGYDSDIKEFVTSMDGMFTERTNPTTGAPSTSKQSASLLLQNYYNDSGQKFISKVLDPNAIEHFVAYLYLWSKAEGSGFIDFANVTYDQPSEEIHGIVADGWARKERLFIDDIVNVEGYEWITKEYPQYIYTTKDAGFLYVSYALLYTEFTAWNRRFYPGQNCVDEKKFRKAISDLKLNTFRVFNQAKGNDRCSLDGGKTKAPAGYGFWQPAIRFPIIDGVTPVLVNEFARQAQVPMQSPHTAQFAPVAPVAPQAQFGPQGGFVLTQETKSTMEVHPPSPNTIDPNLLKMLMTMTPEQQAMLVTNLDPNRGQQQQ